DISIRRQMEDEVGPVHSRRQTIQVEGIAAYQVKARRLLCLYQKLALPGGEVIVPDYLVAALQQAIHQVAADKARASCDKVTQPLLQSLIALCRRQPFWHRERRPAHKFTFRSIMNIGRRFTSS